MSEVNLAIIAMTANGSNRMLAIPKATAIFVYLLSKSYSKIARNAVTQHPIERMIERMRKMAQLLIRNCMMKSS
jgi:hypothetical protein